MKRRGDKKFRSETPSSLTRNIRCCHLIFCACIKLLRPCCYSDRPEPEQIRYHRSYLWFCDGLHPMCAHKCPLICTLLFNARQAFRNKWQEARSVLHPSSEWAQHILHARHPYAKTFWKICINISTSYVAEKKTL